MSQKYAKSNYAPISYSKGAIMTTKKVLKQSMGSCYVVANNIPEKANTTAGSIFDYRIFGMPDYMFFNTYDDQNGGDREEVSIEKQMRFANWGHINLPIPLVLPGSYASANKAFLKQILGPGGKKPDLTDVIVTGLVLGDLILLAPKKGVPFDTAVSNYKTFASKFSKEEWQKLIKEGSLKEVNLNNAHPDTVQVALSSVNKEILPNPKKKILLIKKSTLLSANNQHLTVNNLKQYFTILYGGYAIVELLSYINLANEIAYIDECIQTCKDKIDKAIEAKDFLDSGGHGHLDASQSDSDIDELIENASANFLDGITESAEIKEVFGGVPPIGYRLNKVEYCKAVNTYSELDKLFNEISSLQERGRILKGFVRQEIEPYEFVLEAIPVIPAGYRDINKVDVGNTTSYTSDSINKVYNHLIQFSNSLKRQLGTSRAIPIEKLAAYDELPLEEQVNLGRLIDRTLPIDRTILDRIKFAQMKYTWITQTNADPTGRLKSPADKLKGKPGRFRKHILGERYDYSGTGVIVPEPKLKINQIGLPFKIVIAHCKDDIKYIYNQRYKQPISDTLLENIDKDAMEVSPFKANAVTSRHCRVYKQEDLQAIHQSDELTIPEIAKRVHSIIIQLLADIRYIMIRFPSLWKWNFMGYKIVLTYDKAIKFHPLLCSAYNADFDGDRMSAYQIKTPLAVKEVDEILAPSKSPCDMNGKPFYVPSQDAVIGLYHLSREARFDNIVGIYESYDAMYGDYERGRLDLRDRVTVYLPAYFESVFIDGFLRDKAESEQIHQLQEMNSSLDSNNTYTPIKLVSWGKKFPMRAVTSTVGRFILNYYIPQDMGMVNRTIVSEVKYCNKSTKKIKRQLSSLTLEEFNALPEADKNRAYALEWDQNEGLTGFLNKGGIKKIVQQIDYKYGRDEEAIACYCKDSIKHLGFHYATVIGLTLGLDDIQRFTGKEKIIEEAYKKEKAIKEKYVSNPPLRDEYLCKHWLGVTKDVSDKTIASLSEKNWLLTFFKTEARGSASQIVQMLGMRGLMKNPDGSVRLTPVIESFCEGTSPTAFYDSSYGSAASMADRSQKTKETGSFTRHLAHALQNLIISKGDCGDTEGYLLKDLVWGDEDGQFDALTKNLEGRFLAQDVIDKETGEILLPKGFVYNHRTKEYIEDGVIKKIQEQYGREGIRVRSPLSCKCTKGVCAKCCGYDYSNMRYFKIGTAIGVIVAQGIGQSGTQTVMQNFHTGGVAGEDKNRGFDYAMNALINAKIVPIYERYERLLKLVSSSNAVYTSNRTATKIKEFLTEKGITTVEELNKALNGGLPDFMWEDLGMTASQYYFDMGTEVIQAINTAYSSCDIYYKSVYYEVLAAAVLNIASVVSRGDSSYLEGSPITVGNAINYNLQAVLENKRPLVIKPLFSSLKEIPSLSDSPLGSICFQQVMKMAALGALRNDTDDLTNLSTSFITANILPSGQGFNTVADKYTVQTNYESFEDIIEKAEEHHKSFVESLTGNSWVESKVTEEENTPVEETVTTTSTEEAAPTQEENTPPEESSNTSSTNLEIEDLGWNSN